MGRAYWDSYWDRNEGSGRVCKTRYVVASILDITFDYEDFQFLDPKTSGFELEDMNDLENFGRRHQSQEEIAKALGLEVSVAAKEAIELETAAKAKSISNLNECECTCGNIICRSGQELTTKWS
jgi:hypothetical protein